MRRFQALTGHDVESATSGDVTSSTCRADGPVDELQKRSHRALASAGGKAFVEGAGAVGVQVVHHQRDPQMAPGWQTRRCRCHAKCRPVGFGSARRSPWSCARPARGSVSHEHIVQLPRRGRRTRRSSRAGLTSAAAGTGSRVSLISCRVRLGHAHHRKSRIVGTPVDIENLLHRRREVRVAPSGGITQPDPPPRFDCVFFRTRRTVSCDTLSMWLELHDAIRQQPQRPLRVALRRLGAAQRHQARLGNSPSALRTSSWNDATLPTADCRLHALLDETLLDAIQPCCALICAGSRQMASPRARCSLNSPSSELSRISALITFGD